MTEEWNRYTRGLGAPSGKMLLLAHADLFDAFVAGLQALTREGDPPATPTLAFKSGRVYKLAEPGWTLVIEGGYGRQVGTYVP